MVPGGLGKLNPFSRPRKLDDEFDEDDFDVAGDPLGSHDYTGAPQVAAATPSALPSRKRRLLAWLVRKPHGKLWWVSRIAAGLLALFILLVIWLAVTAPLSQSLKPLRPPQVTLLATDGTPIARKGSIVAAPVQIAKLPKVVPEAFISIEDRRFYSHWGIDPRGIARAIWAKVSTGRTEGGSTITQQLAKFTFLTPDQTLSRKAREIVIAFWLEAWLTKDQILERYLSNAYYGDDAYGLRAASQHYFSREPETLNTAQAAMLAGLMQAPSRYAPTSNYPLAEERMRTVLMAMAEAGYITREQARTLPAPRLHVKARTDLPTGTYFADWALPQARKLAVGGYEAETFRTTLDARLQAAARRAIERGVPGKAQGALVAMRPNGEVVAMVGGRNYGQSPFNRATQAMRQPGSTFKLFVYTAALREGWTPEDTIDGSAIASGSYRPRNAGGHYTAKISLLDAFKTSSNVAAVRLFEQVGSKKVIRTARDLGVTSPISEGDPSVALGTSTMTLLELTSAYAGIAANRFPVVPSAFPVEEKGFLGRLMENKHSLSDHDHDEIEQMLRAVINQGTGRAAMLDVPNYGKTGTTQDNRDALFVGYAGGLVVGVWIGNDDNSPLDGIHGGGVPARIWKDFMNTALGRTAPPARPKAPANPEGPVQPLDLSSEDIGIPDDSKLHIDGNAARFTTQIDGQDIGVSLDDKGLDVKGPGGLRGIISKDGNVRIIGPEGGRPPATPSPGPPPSPTAAAPPPPSP